MNYKLIEGSRFQSLNDKERDTIVFLHGWGGDASAFLFVAKRLAVLGYRCILVDFAGFGDTPEPETPYTVKDYAEDVKDMLVGLKISSATFVCHSFGGRVGIELAANSPEFVQKLVLIDSAGCKPRRKLSYYFKIYTHKFLKKLGFKGLKGSKDYRLLSPVMRDTFKNVVNYHQDGALGRIACPTAIFWGKFDEETPLYMAKRLCKRISGARLYLLDGGHFAYIDDFCRFFGVLTVFLRG